MVYQTLRSIFQRYESDFSIAEAHGMATAMLCIKSHCDAIKWLNEVFEEDGLIIEDDKMQLLELFEQTRKLLDPDESIFEFDLLLPENGLLPEKTEALIKWCQGFLWGIGYTHSDNDWQGETIGILRDLVEFTKLNADVEDNNDDDENAFIQVHEYLRAAVLIIRDELQTNSNHQH